MRFGEYLVAEGRVTADAVQLALAQQRRRRVPLGVLAVRARMLQVDDVDTILRHQVTSTGWTLFGRAARALGLLDAVQVDLLLSRQRESQPRLGELLVEQGAIARDDLPLLLARHRRPHPTLKRPA